MSNCLTPMPFYLISLCNNLQPRGLLSQLISEIEIGKHLFEIGLQLFDIGANSFAIGELLFEIVEQLFQFSERLFFSCLILEILLSRPVYEKTQNSSLSNNCSPISNNPSPIGCRTFN